MAGAVEHAPVLLQEAVDALAVREDGVYVDATFGRGGHSSGILARLGENGRVVALDRDPAAVAAAQGVGDGRLKVVHAPFSRLGNALRGQGVEQVDGVLFDLGVSSPQLDDPRRGFSFRGEGPLDMRMDPGSGETAAQWLATASEKEIVGVIRDYGEERFAHAIAKKIVAARCGPDQPPLASTGQFAAFVAQVVRTREPGQHPATRTFQAVRIFINRELEELEAALPQCVGLLSPGGRLVVISFHSLEDRIVKRFMRAQAQPWADMPARLPLRARDLPAPRLRLLGRARRPSAAEVAANPRARSAVMRVAERI
ncbi:MAG: 16S rRNA (cytosine(1402)-N(4))-methyltransferase RsmH [Betaproteobacteria bacterium]|nr:16S rRNA (cytosine(1402)-N(4))-methyltransferase RsmH [Betaproteobacteria bacterium]